MHFFKPRGQHLIREQSPTKEISPAFSSGPRREVHVTLLVCVSSVAQHMLRVLLSTVGDANL